jgi:23S rRNA pseudouridine1911/1915/1917 synthase
MNRESTVIFEDGHLLVIDKPPGLQVDELQKKHPDYHLVHRLDRDTSGVMVIAKTPPAHGALKKQFHARAVKKTYRAFLYGTVEERGIIEKPIGSARGGAGPRSARAPYGKLREAKTIYRRIAAAGGMSYVEVFPKTGRTHQIRVHFAAIGHPVIADKQYAPGREAALGFKRHALHALSLAFLHPETKKAMHCSAPLPPDFTAAEEELRKNNPSGVA